VALKVPRGTPLDEPEVVRTFLQEERRARTYDPRYHGIYDDRFIRPGAVADLVARAGDVPPPDELRLRHAGLYAGGLPALGARYKRHLEERQRIQAFGRQGGKGPKLEFRGDLYGPEAVKRLLQFLDDQLARDCNKLEDVDREVLHIHYSMSRQLGPAALDALKQRYEFHLALQRILGKLLRQQEKLDTVLGYLNGRQGPVPAGAFQQIFSMLRDVRTALAEALETADRLRLPPLWHMKAGAPLGPFLYDRRLVGQFRWAGSISGKQMGKLYQQLDAVIDRARHIHFKSLGGILSLQEEIARQWLKRFAGGPAGSAAAAADMGR
jgi:hypothetical protein